MSYNISLRQNWFYCNIFMEWIINLHLLPYDLHHISLKIWSLFLLSLDMWWPVSCTGYWNESEVASVWIWVWLSWALYFHLFTHTLLLQHENMVRLACWRMLNHSRQSSQQPGNRQPTHIQISNVWESPPGVKTTVPLSQCKWLAHYPVCYILIVLSHWF